MATRACAAPSSTGDAPLIVVAQNPSRPCVRRQCRLEIADQAENCCRLPPDPHETEVERQLHAPEVGPVVGDETLERQIELADQQPIAAVLVEHLPHPCDDRQYVGLVRAVERHQASIGWVTVAITGIDGIVAELRVLEQVPENVDAESVDAAAEPEAQHVVHRSANVRVTPVEVRLPREKRVAIVLAGRRIELPGAARGKALPVVGWSAVRARVAPDVPIALRAVSRGAGFFEPRVGVGCVVRHEIENDTDAATVKRRH